VALSLVFYLQAQPIINFQTVTTGFPAAVDVVEENTGSGRLFIVQQSGTIRIWNGTTTLATPFLTVAGISTGGERGLLSMAFHPQYATNRYFFVWYTNAAGAVTLARYRRDAANPDIADPTSGVVLLTIPKTASNHNGAKLNFGQDGYLYIGTGDGGGGNDLPNNAQNGDTLLGKMLRIDVNGFATSSPFYSIPPTNPYLSNASIDDEIIALGLRNPWRWSFDKATGDMWIADVGQNAWEEVHYTPAASISSAKNYGWSCYEGMHVNSAGGCGGSTPTNNVLPIYEYPHNNTTGGFVVTGGYVYRGTQYPFLQGYYIMIDYSSGNLWLINSNGSGGWNATRQNALQTSITSFGETSAGELYAVSGAGTLYRVTATSPLPLYLTSFTGRKNGNVHELSWNVQQERSGDVYVVERSVTDQTAFTEIARVSASANNVSNKHRVSVAATAQAVYYRLKMINTDRSIHYSSVIYLSERAIGGVKALKTASGIAIQSEEVIKQIIITDAAGRKLQQHTINGTGSLTLNITNLPKGLLIIRSFTETGSYTSKVMN
jgi:glucose/arabinose dehydrogenase